MTLGPTSWRPIPFRRQAPRDRGLRVAVIGGSTPFASRLFSAMAGVGDLDYPEPVWDLRLLGRDALALESVGRHARKTLPAPHSVVATTSSGPALDGADVVLVQPRIGGLAERARDEDLAEDLGAPADEGLGPGGTRAMLRAAPVLRGIAAELRARCPDALVIAFTNPLSSTVSLLGGAGTESVGVCELPLVTAHEIADRLGVPRTDLSWEFTGLSHRGFVHDLQVGDEGRLADLVSSLRADAATVGGIGADVIEEFGAVPLKYHAMLSGAHRPLAGRGRELLRIREEALGELVVRPDLPPKALARRSMPWYAEAVVPVVLAFAGRRSGNARPFVLDVACDDGLVHEVSADVTPEGVVPLTCPDFPPRAAQQWLGRFYAHEAAVNRLLANPTSDALADALLADAATPDASVDRAVAALAPLVEELAERPVDHAWLRA